MFEISDCGFSFFLHFLVRHETMRMYRYDARASLHDLSEFDGDSWNKQYQVQSNCFRLICCEKYDH